MQKLNEKSHFRQALTLGAVLTLQSMSFSEEQRYLTRSYQGNVFTTHDLVDIDAVVQRSAKKPVFVKLDDGNLLAIVAGPVRPQFYRSFGGYTEYGGGGGVSFEGIGLHGEGETYDSNQYVEINYLEALAYCNNDYSKILKAVDANFQANENTISPQEVESVLEKLVIPDVVSDGHLLANRRSRQLHGIINLPKNVKIPVYVQVDPGVLLCIAEEAGEVTYWKNISGYAVSSRKGTVIIFQGGMEWSTANHYVEVSKEEVVALVNRNTEMLIRAVENQDKILRGSVSPRIVQNELLPYHSPMNSGEDVLTLQQVSYVNTSFTREALEGRDFLVDLASPLSVVVNEEGDKAVVELIDLNRDKLKLSEGSLKTISYLMGYFDSYQGERKNRVQNFPFARKTRTRASKSRMGAILMACELREKQELDKLDTLKKFCVSSMYNRGSGVPILSKEEIALFFHPELNFLDMELSQVPREEMFRLRHRREREEIVRAITQSYLRRDGAASALTFLEDADAKFCCDPSVIAGFRSDVTKLLVEEIEDEVVEDAVRKTEMTAGDLLKIMILKSLFGARLLK